MSNMHSGLSLHQMDADVSESAKETSLHFFAIRLYESKMRRMEIDLRRCGGSWWSSCEMTRLHLITGGSVMSIESMEAIPGVLDYS